MRRSILTAESGGENSQLTLKPSLADWATGTPPLKLVEADNGNYSFPPAVSLGALWASADGTTLYQWGGQFQDNPDVPPPEARTFKYVIESGEWSVVETQGDEVGNAAEGQPAIVPEQGANGDNVAYCTSFFPPRASSLLLPPPVPDPRPADRSQTATGTSTTTRPRAGPTRSLGSTSTR